LGEFRGMSFQSHLPHCRMLPLGEFTMMFGELYATLQGVIIPSAILKIVLAIFYFFCFLNTVWALTSGSFRVAFDTLVEKIAFLHFGDIQTNKLTD